eukprot:GHVP01042484.1.p1 GENE.GHVP01042484.1~~GHVP01042484.1.p1  ORF type:complete len:1075 (+),score=157.98 GHVP01042484.1:32-3256(+)
MSLEKEEDLLNRISQLHRGENVAKNSQWLTDFQRSCEAFDICLSLLNKSSLFEGNDGESVIFFASQTIERLSQTGVPLKTKGSYETFVESLYFALKEQRRPLPHASACQIGLALASCATLSRKRFCDVLDVISTAFASTPTLNGIFVAALEALPEQGRERRIAANSDELNDAAILAIEEGSTALKLITRVLQFSYSFGDEFGQEYTKQVVLSCLRAYKAWYTQAQDDCNTFSQKMLEDHDPYMAIEQRLTADDLDVMTGAADAFNSYICLYNKIGKFGGASISDEVDNLLTKRLCGTLETFRHYVENAGKNSSSTQMEIVIVGYLSCLSPFCIRAFPKVLYDRTEFSGINPQEFLTTNDNSQESVGLNRYLERHDNITFRLAAVTVISSLISHYVSNGVGVCEGSDSDDSDYYEGDDEELEIGGWPIRKKNSNILSSLVLPLYDKVICNLGFSNYESFSHLDYDAWINFKDNASLLVIDLCRVIGWETALERAMELLQNVISECQVQGMDLKWTSAQSLFSSLSLIIGRYISQERLRDKAVLMADGLFRFEYPRDVFARLVLMSEMSRLLVSCLPALIKDRLRMTRLVDSIFQNMNAIISSMKEPIIKDITNTNSSSEAFFQIVFRSSVDCVQSACVGFAPRLSLPEYSSQAHQMLELLSNLSMSDLLDLDSRSTLIFTAGSVISVLPPDQCAQMHRLLVSGLGMRLETEGEKSGKYAKDLAKLFSVSLESVKPVRMIGDVEELSLEDLTAETINQDQVILILEENYSLIRKCLLDKKTSDVVIEAAAHAMVSIFTDMNFPSKVLQHFVADITKSFEQLPTVFQLGHFRSILGLFGCSHEEALLMELAGGLSRVVNVVLEKLNANNGLLVLHNPDLVGMALDCTNAGLQQAPLTSLFCSASFYRDVVNASLVLTPKTDHPKVLTTMLLLILRTCQWIAADETLLYANYFPSDFQEGDPFGNCAEKAVEEIRAIAKECNWEERMIQTVISVLTTTFVGSAYWISIVARIMHLLVQREGRLERVISSSLEKLEMDTEQKESWVKKLSNLPEGPQGNRIVSKFSEDCEALWKLNSQN